MSRSLLAAVRESIDDPAMQRVIRLSHRRWVFLLVRLFSVAAVFTLIAMHMAALMLPFLLVTWVMYRSEKETIVALRADRAVMFERRAGSMSIGPDFYELTRADIKRLSVGPARWLRPATWLVFDVELRAARRSDRALIAWLGG